MATNDLEAAVTSALTEYAEAVGTEVKQAVKDVASECLKEVKANAPERSGAYKKGWRKKIKYDDVSDTRIVIHNAKHYSLAHLLEYGHLTANGKRIEGKPHIRPAEEHAAEKLVEKVKVIVKK